MMIRVDETTGGNNGYVISRESFERENASAATCGMGCWEILDDDKKQGSLMESLRRGDK